MERYKRHFDLIGKDNFQKIQNAKILVAGAGGLGSHVLQVLTRFGFGTIYFYDSGILDESDLNRQILYDANDLNNSKAKLAEKKLREINPNINIIAYSLKIGNDTTVPEVDLVIDCFDNFQGRLVLENLFFKKGIPVVHGGATQFYGQITTLIPGRTKSLSEIYGKDFMETADSSPKDIYPPTVMNIASIQASEAVKLVCGMNNELLTNKILTVDLLNNSFDIIELK